MDFGVDSKATFGVTVSADVGGFDVGATASPAGEF